MLLIDFILYDYKTNCNDNNIEHHQSRRKTKCDRNVIEAQNERNDSKKIVTNSCEVYKYNAGIRYGVVIELKRRDTAGQRPIINSIA